MIFLFVTLKHKMKWSMLVEFGLNQLKSFTRVFFFKCRRKNIQHFEIYSGIKENQCKCIGCYFSEQKNFSISLSEEYHHFGGRGKKRKYAFMVSLCAIHIFSSCCAFKTAHWNTCALALLSRKRIFSGCIISHQVFIEQNISTNLMKALHMISFHALHCMWFIVYTLPVIKT